jgi:hypothetical protein
MALRAGPAMMAVGLLKKIARPKARKSMVKPAKLSGWWCWPRRSR